VADCDALTLPSEVLSLVPEAKHYLQLRDLEKDLDSLIKAKKTDLEEMVIQPYPKIKTMLLLHVYNTHYNQTSGFTLRQENISVPAWCLIIEGKVLLPKLEDCEELATIKPYLRMTHFIRKVEISFNKEQVEYPDIEWNKETHLSGTSGGQAEEDKDGIQVIREGDKEYDLSIAIHINYTPKQFKVKSELSALIGVRQCTRMQAVSALWEYMKANRLQDQEDRKVINCNKELKEAFHPPEFVVDGGGQNRVRIDHGQAGQLAGGAGTLPDRIQVEVKRNEVSGVV
jgi:SWI/SNF-related matrix-associated actin-dependent regulator of chromatin subfamily D